MTLIEFFDKSPIENVISVLALRPERVVFVGERSVMEQKRPFYENFFKRKGIDIRLELCSVNKNDLSDIINRLSDILANEEECAFDLTGGEDLLLVAVGVLFGQYKDIHMHRFNIRNGTIIDCDTDGDVPVRTPQRFSVEDWISLYGGVVARTSTEDARNLDMHREDMDALWALCKNAPGQWNSRIDALNEIQRYNTDMGNPLRICVNRADLLECDGISEKLEAAGAMVATLQSRGLIRDVRWTSAQISYTYSNAFVKNCVSKAGELLEIKILKLAYGMRGNRRPYFHDVDRGVFIDWDGVLHTAEERMTVRDTENEIDVVAMHNLEPIFISCKNGGFNDQELYKLYTVASRFGGPYVKKILVCSQSPDNIERFAHLEQRAKDMGITVIPNLKSLSDDEIRARLKRAISES